MEWKKLTKKTLPPVDNHIGFILWLGLNEDGGFPVHAKRVQYDNSPPYIRYVTPTGWRLLEEKAYRGCLWAAIEEPEEAKAAREAWEKKCRKEREAW